MKLCEYCGKEHDGSYGSGRFCCAKCARKFANQFVDEDGRKRQIQALMDPVNREKGVKIQKQKSEKLRKENKLAKAPRSIFGKDDRPFSRAILGKIGEMRTAEEFGKYGIQVYTPLFNDSPIDMIVDINGQVKKIQVKSSSVSDGDVSTFSLISNNERYGKDGIKRSYIKKYNSAEIDYFALYDYRDDEVFLLRNNINQGNINLRNTPPKNNNSDNTVHYKSDYIFDKVIQEILLDIDPDNVIESENFEIIDEENE